MSRDPGGSSLPTYTRGPLASIIEALVAHLKEEARVAGREEAERFFRVALERGASPSGPAWLSQPRAAAVAGVSAQTIRSWCDAGHLTRGVRGRINAEQLRAYLEGAAPSPAASVGDLDAQRAKATAAAILAGKAGR